MLSIRGKSERFCSGLNRRRFIQIGSLFGLSLADVLRAEARHPASRSKKSVILIWQHGGPSQLDTFDMKPDVVEEVRGPYKSIGSSLPGLPICELMPHHAKVMDTCTVIRSFTHGNGDHWAAAHWMLTGYLGATGADRAARDPSMSAISSHLLGPCRAGIPATININDGGFGFHGAAYLGVAHNPFRIGEFSYGNEAGRLPTGSDKSFTLVDGLTNDRLMNRLSLLDQFDRMRREVDSSNTFENMDSMNAQAQDMLLSGRAREAFNLETEDPKVREKYGPGWGEQALLARRFIEAGARFVTLNTGYWDDHGNIKRALDNKMPRHDRAVGVLLQDLHERGMLDDTLVVTAGEFGRTPTINKDAGRDHWPQTQSILFAGGGYRHGQVIGSTDAKAAYPTSRPVSVEDFCAIVYRSLGLNVHDTVFDPTGRPMHLVPTGEVPREMI
ncbi:MAG: DUF1501 domain-containing protein [Planctomycetales bacterium]|nr:DUF1501 domain-containing protein [Planctomycetales bacterium]